MKKPYQEELMGVSFETQIQDIQAQINYYIESFDSVVFDVDIVNFLIHISDKIDKAFDSIAPIDQL